MAPGTTAPLESVTSPRICVETDRKSTRLNSSHLVISYAVFCLKKKKIFVVHRTRALLHLHVDLDSLLTNLPPPHADLPPPPIYEPHPHGQHSVASHRCVCAAPQ